MRGGLYLGWHLLRVCWAPRAVVVVVKMAPGRTAADTILKKPKSNVSALVYFL